MLRRSASNQSTTAGQRRSLRSSNNGASLAAVDRNNPFLLNSTDFFVGEKDSLLLSESDIFHASSRHSQHHKSSSTKARKMDSFYEQDNGNENDHDADIIAELMSGDLEDLDDFEEEEEQQQDFKTENDENSASISYYNNSSAFPTNVPSSTASASQLFAARSSMSGSHLPDKTKILLGMKRSAGKFPIAPQPPKSSNLQILKTLSTSAAKSSNPQPQPQQHSAPPVLYSMSHSSSNSPSSSNLVDISGAGAKLDKGLRYYSAKVCSKVEEKGCTSYNEVADELVREIGLELGKPDHKNIRRRVYDALNVLMAIDIIRKDKKEIRWLGLPNEMADDLRALEAEKAALQLRIAEKTRNLREILRRCISLKNLIDRNAEAEGSRLDPFNSINNDRLYLPFILISASRDCHVHCEMLEDRTQYFFEFNRAFHINEDIELMRQMGLDTARVELIKSFFPKELINHVLMLCLSQQTSASSSSSTGNPFSGFSAASTAASHSNTIFAPVNSPNCIPSSPV